MSQHDANDPVDMTSVVERLVGQVGGIGVLVNNAGAGQSTSALELGLDEWRKVIGTDLEGKFLNAEWWRGRWRSSGRAGAS